MPTIGSDEAAPFAERGSGKKLSDWNKYPRVTQSPQQYGYGVTPQTMVTPRKSGEYKAGFNPVEMNVARPSRRK